MSMKIRTLGQPEDTIALLALFPAIADVVDDSGFRKPRMLADGRFYRYLTIRRPMRATDPSGFACAPPILRTVLAERVRQLAKWGVQRRIDDTGGPGMQKAADAAKQACQEAEKHASGGAAWRLVLAEEVAEAFAETDPEALRAELIQVAAVAVAWIEDLDLRTMQADWARKAAF